MDKKTKLLIILIILPLILKLIIAFLIPGHVAINDITEYGDTNTFRRMANIQINHESLYSEQHSAFRNRLQYGWPLYKLYHLNGLISISTGLPFYFVMKIVPILAETLISIILFRILKKKYSTEKSFYWSLIYSLNPANLAITAIHGHSDSIPILAMVLAFYYFTKYQRPLIPAIILGLGASTKFYPILLMPILFFKFKDIRDKFTFLTATIASFLVTYVPFMIDGTFTTAISQPFIYTPHLNWGFAKILILAKSLNILPNLLSLIEGLMLNYGKFLLFIALAITIMVYSKVSSLERSFKIIFYCLYSFVFFIHPHYLIWIIPFIFLNINYKESLFIILITVHIYFVYIIRIIGHGLGISIGHPPIFAALSFLFGVLTWLFCISLFFLYLKKDIKNIEPKKILSIRYWL